MANNENKRWWDFYLVRYLIGTLIGSIILYILLFEYEDKELLGKGYEHILCRILELDDTISWSFLLIGGFAISYLASSPVLILHAIRLRTRKLFKRKSKEEKAINKFESKHMIAAVILGTIYGLIFFGLLYMNWIIGVLSLVILIPGVMLTTFWALENGVKEENKMRAEYHKLVLARVAEKNRSDYPESYRHLREHGNAFFIVFTEILFGISLFQVEEPWQVFVVLAVWVVPPSLIWFFANYLEAYLLENKIPSASIDKNGNDSSSDSIK